MTPAAAPGPGPRWRYCSWHHGYATTTQLVQIIEQGSGPGAGLYACQDCRAEHHLVPLTGAAS